jgi:hypothetical protein
MRPVKPNGNSGEDCNKIDDLLVWRLKMVSCNICTVSALGGRRHLQDMGRNVTVTNCRPRCQIIARVMLKILRRSGCRQDTEMRSLSIEIKRLGFAFTNEKTSTF